MMLFIAPRGQAGVARAFAQAIGNSQAEFENAEVETEVAFELANLVDTKQGYWLELRYPFCPAILSQTFLGLSGYGQRHRGHRRGYS